MARGERNDMGPTAVLDTGKVEIVVISSHVEPHDIAAFTAVGIDPMAKRYVMLKSRVHWRAGLGQLASAVVECAGTGVCTSDYATLKFNKVRRPIFPLDEGIAFRPVARVFRRGDNEIDSPSPPRSEGCPRPR